MPQKSQRSEISVRTANSTTSHLIGKREIERVRGQPVSIISQKIPTSCEIDKSDVNRITGVILGNPEIERSRSHAESAIREGNELAGNVGDCEAYGIPQLIDCVVSVHGDNRPHVEVEILGYGVTGLLDSGATCTILGGSEVHMSLERMGIQMIPVESRIKTADGTSHQVTHAADIPYIVDGRCKVVRSLVVPSIERELICGIDFWETFGIRPSVSGTESCLVMDDIMDVTEDDEGKEHKLNDRQREILDRTSDLFLLTRLDKLGCTKLIEHNIDTGNAKPVKVRARPVSPYVQAEMNKELDRMLRLGVVEMAGPTEWAHPVVCVRKPSGKIRFCLDARRLNEVTTKDTYPLPYINRILGRLSGTRYLSSIDLSDAFWQIELNAASRPKTAFIVPGRGLFQYKRMPFGLCNASQTLCRLMDKVLGVDLEPRVFVYLDDIIVMSQTFEEHTELLQEVAQRLRRANLTVSLEKSRFCLKEIKYLGYILDEHGLRVDPEKITGILNFATPKTVKDTRRLIGMAGWYRRFIPDFSSVTAPITNLLGKASGKKFVWTNEAQKAFMDLKALLVSAPILVNPDFGRMFTIQTDASDTGIGAVLTQVIDGEEKVIAYMSQKLTCTQRKYPATERECLAVVLAIEKFRPYIEGVRFTVVTDCASLVWLRSLKDPASRLARWSMRLQQYDFQLLHRNGKHNVVPDALSRAVESIEVQRVLQDDAASRRIREGMLESPERYADFRVENGQLYKYCQSKTGDGAFTWDWKLYVPEAGRKKILSENHDNPLAAHLGYYKTLKRIQENYYWPGLAKDVRRYVQVCAKCQVNKPKCQLERVPLGQLHEPTRPWEMVAVDFLGPYPRSKSGNQYAVVVVDVFSKFVLLRPVRRAETKSLVRYLEEDVFLVFGVPSTLISDNGSQFTSKAFTDFLKGYNVTHWKNAHYHPQANPAERVNRSVLSAVRCYIGDDHRNWDGNIAHIACALRTAVHESSKFTPYYINFGRNMKVSGARDASVRKPDEENAEDHAQRLEQVRRAVAENLRQAYGRYSHHYNLRSRPRQFAVGDTVLKKSFNQSKAVDRYNAKFDAVYEKCTVVGKTGLNTYILQDMQGKDIGRFHVNTLRPYYGDS